MHDDRLPTVHFRLPDGTVQSVRARASDYTVLVAAKRAGVPGIAGHCGGNRACATCHVHVAEAWRSVIGPAGGDERALLEDIDNCQPASRLCCQIAITPLLDGLELQPVP